MTIIAHVADAHLGQRLVVGGGVEGGRMHYEDAPEENEEHLRRVLDDVARAGIADIVFGGDIGSRSATARFFEILDRRGVAPAMVLGNHDTYADVAQRAGGGTNPVEGKLCSSLDDGPWRRITLDTSDNAVGDRQRAWLAGELGGTSRAAVFVHHPVLEIDTPIDRSGAALRDRGELRALLGSAACGVAVFCGHYHMVDEAREGNVRQFATPAVSYEIVKRADRIRVDVHTFGYRVIAFDGPEIRTRCVLLTDPA